MTEKMFLSFILGASFSIYSVIALYRDKHGLPEPYDVKIYAGKQYVCKEEG
jgi:hypothetical protein